MENKLNLEFLRIFGSNSFLFIEMNSKKIKTFASHLLKEYLLGSEKDVAAEFFVRKII